MRYGKITLAELNERWLETEMSGGVTVSNLFKISK
jgi:hypothetical protein